MKRGLIIIICVILIVGVASYIIFFRKKQFSYQTVKIDRGDIVSTVSTTGNLQYVKYIGVYSLQSGIVEGVYADYNQRVKKGALLAKLDVSLLKLSLKEAEQNLLKNSNSLEQTKKEYQDTLALYESGFVSEKEKDDAEYNFKSADLTFKASEVAYESAKLNYNNGFIYSPMDGVVVSRNIDVGTNVNANSLLFIIAQDLANLQIEALIDETEIGSIKPGQKVNFTVGAFPDKTFTGKVVQIRFAPQTIQNVVNYSVIIKVDNREKNLFPGMTASVDIIVESRSNVLRVPNTALRFRPSQDILKNLRKEFQAKNANVNRGLLTEKKVNRDSMGILWVYDRKNNTVKPLPVKTGFSDGKYTEVVPLHDENNIEGLEIITSVSSGNKGSNVQSSPMLFGPSLGPPPRIR